MEFLHLYISWLLIVFVSGGDASSTGTMTRGDRKKRLIGGINVTITAHPYFVSLEKCNIPACGGAIVTERHVLTAAHCIQSEVPGWYVRAASDMTKQGKDELHPVHRFDSHPNYFRHLSEGNMNDIGVITVRRVFLFNRYLQPVALFNFGELIEPKSVAVIVGIGMIQSRVRTAQLQRITVPVISRAQCHEFYKPKEAPSLGTFCAGYERGGLGPCSGDSGGPVTIGGRLAGIVSFGAGCGLPGLPAINTEIAFFRKWIDSKMIL